jgi:hypothetical protein
VVWGLDINTLVKRQQYYFEDDYNRKTLQTSLF